MMMALRSTPLGNFLFMEALLPTPSSSSYLPLKSPQMMIGNVVRVNNNSCSIFATGYPSYSSSCSFPFSAHNLSAGPRKSVSVIVRARKKDDKEDSHSFVPKPDEATGFFPEAVLLKEKKVEEDGKVLPEFADAEERQLFESLMLELESDMNVEQMRHYEVMYLIHEKHAEEVAAVNEKVQNFLREKKGRVWRLNDWGMRRLAYKIQKAERAHYMLMNFEVDAKHINEFKSLLDKDERVIRHLVIKRDEAITEDCPPPPEFPSLSANIDDYHDDDEEEEINAEYDDGDYGDDWDDEDEMDGYDDDGGEEIIFVDGGNDDGRESRNNTLTDVRKPDRGKLRTEKVSR